MDPTDSSVRHSILLVASTSLDPFGFTLSKTAFIGDFNFTKAEKSARTWPSWVRSNRNVSLNIGS